MRNLFISFFLLLSTSSIAQKHELSLDYRFGIDLGGTNFNSVLTSTYDHGAMLQFKYRIWNKAKLYFMFGYDQSSARYSIYEDIFGKPERPYPFNVLNVNRHGLHLGLNKKIELNKFTIDVGVNCVTRTKIYKNLVYTAHGGLQDSSPTHRYLTFETRPFYRDFGLEFNTDVSYALLENVSLNMGVTHSRGHFMEYVSSASQTDSNGAVSSSPLQNYFEVNNFLYLRVGIIYLL